MNKILVLSILDVNCLKDNGIYNDLFLELGKSNSIDILSISNMKEETFQYSENIKIYRVDSKKIFNIGKIRKALNLLKLNKKFKQIIKKYLKNERYDMVLYSTPPITLNSTIKYAKKRYNAKTYLLLKDIFPQNAVDLNIMNKNGIIHKYFKIKENNLYRLSDNIGVMSPKNKKFIVENNNVESIKVEINPNSIKIKDKNIFSESEKEYTLKKYNLPLNKTKFIYGGNLGLPQGIRYICEVLLLNESTNNHIVIVGDGTEKEKLVDFLKDNNLKNTTFISKLSKEKYELLVQSCDVGLIFLDNKFTIPNIPSRLLTYLEFSKPVIAATDINTDFKDIIKDGKFGYWCESSDPNIIISLFEKIKKDNNYELLGNNGRKYLESKYDVKISSKLIIDKLKEV